MRTVTAGWLLALGLLAPVAARADVEDLLWDLQIIPLDGRPAPGFTLEALGGRKVALADFRDHVTLLYFWLTS